MFLQVSGKQDRVALAQPILDNKPYHNYRKDFSGSSNHVSLRLFYILKCFLQLKDLYKLSGGLRTGSRGRCSPLSLIQSRRE